METLNVHKLIQAQHQRPENALPGSSSSRKLLKPQAVEPRALPLPWEATPQQWPSHRASGPMPVVCRRTPPEDRTLQAGPSAKTATHGQQPRPTQSGISSHDHPHPQGPSVDPAAQPPAPSKGTARALATYPVRTTTKSMTFQPFRK